MKKSVFTLLFAVFFSVASFAVAAYSSVTIQHESHQSAKEKSDHQHSQHHAEMNKRGDHAMGFSQEKTTHHFRMFKDGGAIEVTANSAADKESLNQIRMHLSHIARMFSEGNFSTPMLVHDELPPGAKVMAEMKAEITYKFEEKESGGQVRISTGNSQALSAIHQFLRYQIKEHQTGDSIEISAP
jgi:Ni/Co efflux regulator RcnB